MKKNLKNLLIFAALAVQAVLFASTLRSLDAAGDFTAFYRAGAMLRTGTQLYDMNAQQDAARAMFPGHPGQLVLFFYHPAYEAVLFAPLSALAYQTAFWVWALLSILFVLLGSRALGIPLLLPLLFYPVLVAMLNGQDSMLQFALVALAYRAFSKEQDSLAGALLALALFKFQIILPLVAILLLHRRWRILLGFAPIAAALAGVSAAIGGVSSYWQILTGHRYENGLRVPTIHGFVESLGGPQAVTILLSLAVIAWVAWRKPESRKNEFSAAVLAALLVSYHLHVYDLVLVLIPLSTMLKKGSQFLAVILASATCLLLPTAECSFLLALPLFVGLFFIQQTALTLRISHVAMSRMSQ